MTWFRRNKRHTVIDVATGLSATACCEADAMDLLRERVEYAAYRREHSIAATAYFDGVRHGRDLQRDWPDAPA